MKYFGISKCPYCGKRVNLVRIWSLRRQGEYKCPRCSGISNVFLSPLIHVAAILTIFASGVLYFFHKFVLNKLEITTVITVFLPFLIFYVLSLFMVYLEKPVLKKRTPKKRTEVPMPPKKMQRQSASRLANASLGTEELFDENMLLPSLQGTGSEAAQAVQQPVRHQAQPVKALDSRYIRENPKAKQHPKRSIEVTMPIAPRKPEAEDRVVQKIELDGNIFQKYNDQGYVQQRIDEDQKNNT